MRIDYSIEDFPMCCGAMILCDFPFVDEWFDDDLPDVTELKGFDEEIKKDLQTGPEFSFAILTANQRDVFGDRLIKAGFQCVRRGINSNTGNMLYVYIRGGQAVRPPKRKAKPKKRK